MIDREKEIDNGRQIDVVRRHIELASQHGELAQALKYFAETRLGPEEFGEDTRKEIAEDLLNTGCYLLGEFGGSLSPAKEVEAGLKFALFDHALATIHRSQKGGVHYPTPVSPLERAVLAISARLKEISPRVHNVSKIAFDVMRSHDNDNLSDFKVIRT